MIIKDFYIFLTSDQEALLMEKYKDLVMVKTVFKTHMDNAIQYECTKIKNEKEKAEKILNQTEKL